MSWQLSCRRMCKKCQQSNGQCKKIHQKSVFNKLILQVKACLRNGRLDMVLELSTYGSCHLHVIHPYTPCPRFGSCLADYSRNYWWLFSINYIIQAAITMTTVLVPCHAIKSLRLIYYWASRISFTGAQSSTCDCRSVIYKDTPT